MGIVGLELKLNPWKLSELYLDDQDMFGLYWWADVIKEQNEKAKSK